VSEHDEPALRARRVRKARERKGASRWLEKRGGAASVRGEGYGRPAPDYGLREENPTPEPAQLDDDAATFFRAGDEAHALADLDLDDERAEPALDPEVAARAATRRRSFSRHVLGIVVVALVLCGAAIARSAASSTSTNVFPASAMLAESRGAAASAPALTSVSAPVLVVPPPPPVIAEPEAPLDATTAAKAGATSPAVAARVARERARFLLEKGAGADAIVAGQRSVELDPTDAEAWLVLGAAYQLVGKGREARSAFYSCTKLAKRGPVGECSALNL
jgi:hypothetical protein